MLLRAQNFLVWGILNKSWPQVAEFRCYSNKMSFRIMLKRQENLALCWVVTESEIKYSKINQIKLKWFFLGFGFGLK